MPLAMRTIMDSCRDIHVVSFDKPEKQRPFYQQSSIVTAVEEPEIKPHFRPVDYAETLAEIYAELESLADTDHGEKLMRYLEQSFVFRGLGEHKSLRRSLRLARQHAPTTQLRLVIGAWLRYERRGEEVDELCSESRACSTSKLGDHIPCLSPNYSSRCSDGDEQASCSEEKLVDGDVTFHVDGESVHFQRQSLAELSEPFNAMLNGDFRESTSGSIDFSRNGLSAPGLKAMERFSRTGRLEQVSPSVLAEVLAFCNIYLCNKLRDACDRKLATMVHTFQDAIAFVDVALQEKAQALLAACFQAFLREIPFSLRSPQVYRLFCSEDGRRELAACGYSSFPLYCLLSQASIEEDASSDVTVKLLHFAEETATSQRQRVLILHQLGCSMLARKQYSEAHNYFEAAADGGHTYSLAGVARVKYKRGHTMAAYAEACCTMDTTKLSGWMFEDRSLYSQGQDKLKDLNTATELDPTLTYPYKYRAALLMDEKKVHDAIGEISRVLRFNVSKDCLEFRVYLNLALGDYRAAVRDVRVILTFDPRFKMYTGRVPAADLLKLLNEHITPWTKADCWMKLYDYWSSVDDINSLAVVHQMLESESSKGVLFFRQSLLLLRLNCPRAALRSLKLARENADTHQEKLVYEGWLLYDTGHRQEALRKAEESIAIQRSFEAFFLKAYVLADTNLDPAACAKVIGLLEEALKCPSDGLRKGQALNNLGSVYVDSGNLDMALECYTSALKIRHTRAHQGLARVHFLRGDKKAAFDEMTKLIQKATNNASAYEKRAEYGDRDLMLADLNMASLIDPLRTYPYRFRAALAMDRYNQREATTELSRAIAFKVDIQLVHLKAAFHDSVGRLRDAVRDCRAALSIDPNHSETLDIYRRLKIGLQHIENW